MRPFHHIVARILLIAGLGLPLASTAHAAPVAVIERGVPYPAEEEARYRIYWNGVRLGKIWLYWKEDAGHYEAKIAIKTSGVARIFSKQDRGASVSGRWVRQGGMEYYVPERYEYHAAGKRKNRLVEITYHADGMVKSSTVNPPDDPARRTPVSSTARNVAYDPLTAMRAILNYAQTLSQGGRDSSRRFTVFDGRRQTEIHAVPAPRATCGAGCVVASGSRTLLEGYTEEEKQEFKERKEAPVAIEIAPAHSRFPQKMYAATAFGEVVAKRY